MRESLYSQIIIWVNTILNHIDTSIILPKYEGPCMVHLYESVPAKFLCIVGQDPSDFKSSRLHVDILTFCFIHLKYIL